jgi:hypothetical protein
MPIAVDVARGQTVWSDVARIDLMRFPVRGFARIASTATRALNCGLYCFLVVVIDRSLSTTSPKSLAYSLV